MTRRSSVRAQAREIYRDLVHEAAAQSVSAATPLPNPPPQGGRGQAAQGAREQKEGKGKQTSLTARVRALYEDSAVPVREIAALAGVTERTIYKYVSKHGWKRRYRWAPRGDDQDLAAAANRGRRWRPSPNFVPAKGAGGRFIRREDKDKPIATGLKATDPAAARLAAARCVGAAHRAALAQARAEQAQRCERHIRAIECTHSALKNLRDYREARKDKNLRAPVADRIEQLLALAVDVALKGWEALMAPPRSPPLQ